MFKVDFKSLDIHCIKPKHGFALKVRLLASENEYIAYPAKGVLVIAEQGVTLEPIVAVFHRLRDDGTLGPPVRVRNPRFESESTSYPLKEGPTT